jgi:class 3 adenylate cyclase
VATNVEHGWARTADDLCIAYEVSGAGPPDVVAVPGLLNTLMGPRVYPPFAQLDQDIARFARLIKLDKRGTGLSDRLPRGVVAPIEERIDDVRAVMDTVGSERACVVGTADGGPLAIVFAATYPERVASLVLNATSPRARWAPDWPWGIEEERFHELISVLEAEWGGGVWADISGKASDGDSGHIDELERIAGTPTAAAAALTALWETDVRDALSSVTAPTVVVHSPDDSVWPFEAARYLVEHLPEARFVERAPGGPPLVGPRGVLAGIVEEAATGAQSDAEIDRVLKTILFTDIVRSTELASRLGDRRWRELLDEHDQTVREALGRHRGDEINTTGDGFLASFDGPARAIRCARDITEAARGLDLEVRAGIHTGECERRGDDLSGIAVHIGSRVAALADGQEILVTGTVRDLVAGSGIEFDDRGHQTLKGVPGEWQVLEVSSLG